MPSSGFWLFLFRLCVFYSDTYFVGLNVSGVGKIAKIAKSNNKIPTMKQNKVLQNHSETKMVVQRLVHK
jgi:hypothetical protein